MLDRDPGCLQSRILVRPAPSGISGLVCTVYMARTACCIDDAGREACVATKWHGETTISTLDLSAGLMEFQAGCAARCLAMLLPTYATLKVQLLVLAPVSGMHHCFKCLYSYQGHKLATHAIQPEG